MHDKRGTRAAVGTTFFWSIFMLHVGQRPNPTLTLPVALTLTLTLTLRRLKIGRGRSSGSAASLGVRPPKTWTAGSSASPNHTVVVSIFLAAGVARVKSQGGAMSTASPR